MSFMDTIQDKQVVFGKETTYLDFKTGMKTIEVYRDSSHDTRALKQDEDGQLWLYDFHEEMNFSGPDMIYEHFFKVDSAEQAEKYKDKHLMALKIDLRPFAYIGPGSSKIYTFEK